MNQSLTEIAFVLDRSGSMAAVAESAVAGFNEFLRDQQAAPGEARLTLALFDDEYLLPCRAARIKEVCPLDASTYVPRGSTALLDAIGRTVDELGARLAASPEAERPGRVIVAILTDGCENASQRYTHGDVAARVRHQCDKYAWQFLFLGANQDALATAAAMHIGAHDAATFRADAAGARAGFKAASQKVKLARLVAPPGTRAEDRPRPLTEILADEDGIERGQPSLQRIQEPQQRRWTPTRRARVRPTGSVSQGDRP